MTAETQPAEQAWPDGGGYSPSGNSWACPEPGCGYGVAGLNSPVFDWDDPFDVDPVGEHLRMHEDAGTIALQTSTTFSAGIEVQAEFARLTELTEPVDEQRPPQHARLSRRSSLMLGRVLVGVVLLALVAVVGLLLASVLNGGPLGVDLALRLLAWLLIVPGALVLVSCAGAAALAALERWYERRGGGSR